HQDSSKEIEKELIKFFLEECKKKLNIPDFEEKLKRIDALVAMDWVLHYLNVLKPDFIKHLQFAHEGDQDYIENLIEDRLNKAEFKLNLLKNSLNI
ncbi:MAG: hypothetical protein AABX71_02450, partial [Nanoarchaeota archaeon]